MKYVFTLLFLAANTASLAAAVTPATWSSSTSGSLASGISIDVMSTASIVGLTAHFGPSSWDGNMPLGATDQGVTVFAEVNTYQEFHFSEPVVGGTLWYIENFDSSSHAAVTINGGTASLVDASSSISYGGGYLSTTNTSYNGEGDAVLALSEGVTSVSIGYHETVGANGVFYTFAEPVTANAVPEPASIMVMAGLFGLGGLVYLRKRK